MIVELLSIVNPVVENEVQPSSLIVYGARMEHSNSFPPTNLVAEAARRRLIVTRSSRQANYLTQVVRGQRGRWSDRQLALQAPYPSPRYFLLFPRRIFPIPQLLCEIFSLDFTVAIVWILPLCFVLLPSFRPSPSPCLHPPARSRPRIEHVSISLCLFALCLLLHKTAVGAASSVLLGSHVRTWFQL
ncbi:hypothetical protein K402DRAFT_169921 [Aulographum hederae CBS 113979]|uniref:Uncharacterized protein n=1 Tax=Aulographum hederae CBS 113979 TaxID=1176131 RepID=A0A6G1HDB9_9PEZI|nr:hypothetical protein K402DRAFT_169921 [Aulographum hederae CBS 113979]